MKKVSLVVAAALLMSTVTFAQDAKDKKQEPVKKEEKKAEKKEEKKAEHKGGHKKGEHKEEKKAPEPAKTK